MKELNCRIKGSGHACQLEVGKDDVVEWSERNRERLEVALTEADVVGVRQVGGDSLAFLMHVMALPEAGPMDNDARRLLVLHGVTQAQFLLRRVSVEGNGPAIPIPIPTVAAIDEFFGRQSTGGSMYGWRYFDEPALIADWPEEPSLVVALGDHDASHSFYWFNECARLEEGELRSYCIEGTAKFDDRTVLRADGAAQSAVADEGVRWWQAFQDFEDRVNSDAQRAWNSSRLTWREWPGLSAPAP